MQYLVVLECLACCRRYPPTGVGTKSHVIVCPHGLLTQGKKLWRGGHRALQDVDASAHLRHRATTALQRAILAHPAKASGNKKRRKLITEGQSRHLSTYPGSSSRHQALVQQRVRRNTYRKVTRLRQAKSTPSRLQVVIAGSPRRSLLFIPQSASDARTTTAAVPPPVLQ